MYFPTPTFVAMTFYTNSHFTKLLLSAQSVSPSTCLDNCSGTGTEEDGMTSWGEVKITKVKGHTNVKGQINNFQERSYQCQRTDQ